MSVFNQNTRRVLSYGSRKRSYDQKGCVRGVDLRLRRMTSSMSQTLRRRLVRTKTDGRRRECSARRLPPSVAALLSRRSRKRERLSVSELFVRLLVCLLVCLSVTKMQKKRFSRKLSNLELWLLLTTYRKSYIIGFSTNP